MRETNGVEAAGIVLAIAVASEITALKSIYFARIESVDAVIKALEKLKNRWESDELKLS